MKRARLLGAVVLGTFLLLLVALAGCGQAEKKTQAPAGEAKGTTQAQQPAESAAKPAQAAYKMTIVGGSAGGMWSVITEGAAEAIRRSLPDAQITTEPGKDGPNQVMVSTGEVQFAVTNEATSVAAQKGLEPYDKAYPKLRGVAVLNPVSPFQFFIDKKAGIESFEQIKEKKYPLRIGVNQKGSLMEISIRKVLAAYGITYDDIKNWGGKVEFVRANQALELWDANQLVAVSEVAQYPLSSYVEHSTKHELRMLPLNDAAIQKVGQELGMTPLTIPANTYTFQKEAMPTINTKLLLVAAEDLDADMVYSVVKGLHSNLDYLHNVHEALKTLDGKGLSDMVLPLHPGAEKFYKEVGALK